VSLYAYINPVIAVALGVLVLHEPFTWRMAIAAGLVFGGVALVRLAQRPEASKGSSSKPATNGTVEPGKHEAANLKRRSVA
jgi:EamA-like transporter family